MKLAGWSALRAGLEKYAGALHLPPHGRPVVSNIPEFLAHKPLRRRVWLRAKRDLALALSGQLALARRTVPAGARKVLYVYLGTPNLGDSIMDLSPRVLWKDRPLQVDMLTSPAVAAFYKDDPSFHRIVCDVRSLAEDPDFIVLHSYSWKCLKIKWKHFFLRPFASLHGHYYGCEFNRLAFAEGAWRQVLALPQGQGGPALPAVFNLKHDHAAPALRTGEVVAVALGGIVDWRIYPHWKQVIDLVSEQAPGVTWLLLGSDNALAQAESLAQARTGSMVNEVGRLSLDQVFEHLRRASMLLAADGGLLNMGRAAGTPMVGLFAGSIHPRMRLADGDPVHAIHAPQAVSEIPAQCIAQAVLERLQARSTCALQLRFLGAEPLCPE